MDVNDMRTMVTLASFVLFLGIVVRTLRRKHRAAFDDAAQLPLIGDDVAGTTPTSSAQSKGEPQ
jgi:cytochrome c oxidase cbb3-type subunit 4